MMDDKSVPEWLQNVQRWTQDRLSARSRLHRDSAGEFVRLAEVVEAVRDALDENSRLRNALQRIMQVLGPDVPTRVDYTDKWNAAGLVAEQREALHILRESGIEYQKRGDTK